MAPRSARTDWITAGFVLAAIGVTAPACGPASGAGAPSATAPAAKSPGHDRMIAKLQAVAERTDEENTFLGAGLARAAKKALADLPADATAGRRVKARLECALQELRLGEAQSAIEHLTAAQALVPELGPRDDPDAATEVAFRLGIAWLRLGETDNCCRLPSPESCIVPIRGSGLHAEKRGSKQAMQHFRDVLRIGKANPIYAYKARWLLNLAAMTLGEWPQGLTQEELIPQTAFDSGVVIPRFENVAAQVGADTLNLAGGAIVDDLDGDGFLDILTSTSDARRPMRFLHNDGRGVFEDRTAAAGLLGEFGGLNMTDADYDNDGDLDVFVMRGGWFPVPGGRVPHSLLRNDGAGHFTDVTFDAGLGEKDFPTSAAAWGDYDGDGHLDLCVGSEMNAENQIPNQLFRNRGDGTFVDVAKAAGVENWQFAKAICWGDYDNDRRPDLFVSNCGGLNRLYHNDGDGKFTDVAPRLDVARPMSSFGAFFFDYDNDGVLDLYVTGFRGITGEVARVAASALGVPMDATIETQRLCRGDGKGGFKDVTAECGLDRVLAPMGHNFGDLNNDGWLDFYLGTGYPDYEALMPNVMYLNQEGKRFADVSWSGGFGHLQKGHGIAFADVDGDGDTDVFAEMGGAYPGDAYYNALYRNPGFGNHFLTVHLVGHRSNRCAIGARIRADIVEGERRRSIHREVNTGGSFGCNPLRQMLGLGRATRVERLEVTWPTTGLVQVFTDIPADGAIRIVEDTEGFQRVSR